MDDFEEAIKEMKALEGELRQSLQHVPAPAGFTDRVMERVAQRTSSRKARGFGSTLWPASLSGIPARAWWTAAAAALVLTVGGGDALHLRHQRQEREAAAARAQIDLAMELTGHALTEVGESLENSSARRFVQLWNGQ